MQKVKVSVDQTPDGPAATFTDLFGTSSQTLASLVEQLNEAGLGTYHVAPELGSLLIRAALVVEALNGALPGWFEKANT